MQLARRLAVLYAALSGVYAAGKNAAPLVSSPADIRGYSEPGADVSGWYRTVSRGTVMAGLLGDGVYDDTDLFYSDNMKKLDTDATFRSPWLYREEFTVHPAGGQYFSLHTNGITSKADIYVNGKLLASNQQQQGSYGGHRYNLTSHLQTGVNCILIQAYPTNYLRDFAMGFVDWNPYPADNGTGVWRNVRISQTGPVAMSPLRVITDFTGPEAGPKVNVQLKTDLINHTGKSIRVTVSGTIKAPDGSEAGVIETTLEMNPHQNKTISMNAVIGHPQVWWPAGWGDQPLYAVQATAYVEDKRKVVSDATSPQHFGIRHVSSHLNAHNDTAFAVNGWPFQVRGAGYGPDLFMRFDTVRVRSILRYVLDMGMNTIRLEGKQEQPELYELADQMGVMILAGWECCDKWEGWTYNDEADGVKWDNADYPIARSAMLHEAQMMQAHPSMLGFLVGSDYWPNDGATTVYLNSLKRMDWQNPIIASAAERGYPKALGLSGMKMNGPYDWVPPNYWYGNQEGAAFGFGSELGSGVGTPELDALKKFMSSSDLETLWKNPNSTQYHMSRYDSQFYDRSIYNEGLYKRYGAPKTLKDYVIKCQMADYEAARSQFEAFSAFQSTERPATGAIYWMLNGAWPNLHWQLFDYYLNPMGVYFGTKVGNRMEHVAYNYQNQSIWLINHSRETKGNRVVAIELVDIDGKQISSSTIHTSTAPISSKEILQLSAIEKVSDVAFLRLVLHDPEVDVDLSRNVYWVSPKNDVLNWKNSDWYYTPVTEYTDYTKLETMSTAIVDGSIQSINSAQDGWVQATVQLENKSGIPAVFNRLRATNSSDGSDIAPIYWSDNYVTLWPHEKLSLSVSFQGRVADLKIDVSGWNIKSQEVKNRG